ncbi:MAG: AAA family ATPase [Verrucomicrobia bacterium]|nr:AAA family ATPase [Verrucomicrobiota bacterium]
MLTLRNFKNFAEASFDLDQPVTLLIGPNGAGKSNLIEAIELFSFLASGRPLHEVTDIGRGGGLEIRGGLAACARRGSSSFEFELFLAGDGVPAVALIYQLEIDVSGEPRICRESLRSMIEPLPLFEVLPSMGSVANEVRYNNHDRGPHKPITTAAADRTALSQYARFATKDLKLTESLRMIDAVSSAIQPPAVIDPIPKLMRGYERQSERVLARNAFNLSPVLRHLAQGAHATLRADAPDDRHPKKILLDRIARLPDEAFTDFEFIDTKAGDVMLGFRVASSPDPIDARVLSDGTLRALALLTALETVTQHQLLILEELDNGIHPSRLGMLVESVFESARRRNLRLLATTHNPATMDALQPDQLGAVLLVTHDAARGSSRLTPLLKLPGALDFVESGSLGDLVTRRAYEEYLKPNYDEEKRKSLEQWMEATK